MCLYIIILTPENEELAETIRANPDQAKLTPYDMTIAQIFLMLCVSKEDGQSQNELAKLLQIKAPSLTSLLVQLEKKGLIERRPDPEDGRTKRIYLCPSGIQFMDETIWPLFDQLEKMLLRGFAPDEKKMLLSFLTRLEHNVQSIKRN